MVSHIPFEKPRWIRDLLRFLPLKSHFVLSGNVRDLHITEDSTGTLAPVSIIHALHNELKAAGYIATLVYDLISGFARYGTNEQETAASRMLMERLNLSRADGNAPAGTAVLVDVLARLNALDGSPVALLVDFASRLVVRADTLTDSEHRLFAGALVQSLRARARPAGSDRVPAFNTVIWIVEREANLPDWLVIDNPRLRHIPVGRPDGHARSVLAPNLLRHMPEGAALDDSGLAQVSREFVDETEGLLLLDLTAISQLARRERIPVTKIGNAIRNYKVGVTEDPWRKIPADKIRNGEATITERVKGQDHAVVHLLDIIKRAITGVGANRRGGRPRGVAFLAGPTGVGKTELAKTVTRLLFNDERS
jgi:hypothetical protein